MASNKFNKDPDALLDFQVDWSTWLPTGDTITASEWIVPSGITKTDESFTTTTATVWLSGGTVGTTYELVNRITTDQGRINDQTIKIVIKER